MNQRIVDDPSLHGWVQDGDKWVWYSSGGGGIQGGDTEGQVTTWDGAKWTPDSSLTIDAAGDASFSGAVDAVGFAGDGSTLTGVATAGYEESGDFNDQLTNPFVNSFNASANAPNGVDGWYNTINIRHRGGSGDGTRYGAQIAVGMTQQTGRLFLRHQSADNWGSWKEIGGGGLPDGDFTHNGTITATDFIATSDERVKDNITTAPVGLIDSLKGREWDWKESGEKGSGVVAQELEQVLPHLVHTDDEGMKSVAYNGLVAYLIEEVKLLRAEVEALK